MRLLNLLQISSGGAPIGDGDTFPTLTDAVGGANATVVNGSSANFVGDVPA